jgi:hypothetical protein
MCFPFSIELANQSSSDLCGATQAKLAASSMLPSPTSAPVASRTSHRFPDSRKDFMELLRIGDRMAALVDVRATFLAARRYSQAAARCVRAAALQDFDKCGVLQKTRKDRAQRFGRTLVQAPRSRLAS